MKKITIPFLLLFLALGSTMKAGNTDLTNIDNVIYVTPLTATAGDQVKLSVCMKNAAPIRGFQFNLYLPEGVTAATNNKGRIICSLSPSRLEEDDEHTLTLATQADGSILFLCGSQYDENFTGSDGEIATLTVNIAEDLGSGDYPVFLRNIKLTETDISKYYETAEVESTITILGTVGINSVPQADGSSAPVFSLSGQRLTAPRKGVNIVGGQKVVVR